MAPFCSCPASLVSRKFFAVGPGCAKCFFFVALRWAPRPFGGARAKKKTPPRVFFFAPALGKGRRRRSPVPAPNGASPSLAFRRGRSKKKHHPGWCFFCLLLAPCRRPTGLLLPLPFPGAGAKKKHPWWCFFCFALAPCRRPTGLLLPLPFPGAGAKKNTPWVVFFFCCGPSGRSLTHCGPGWRCLPLAGVVFFVVLLRPRPDRGGVFFLLWPRPDAHSLTVGWGDFGKARVVFFFWLRPRRVFLDNNKNVWGTTSSLKRPGGPQQKKKTPLPV